MEKRTKTFLILMFSIFVSITNCYAKGDFFEQRYRGWLWFEDKEQAKEKAANKVEIAPEVAKEEMEEFSRQLEERKYIMFARPTPENVKSYRDKEKEMWDKAMELQESWDMANFLYPEQRDQINNPDNVHAVKLKRKLEQEGQDKVIKEFAANFELVAFFKNNCRYCHEFVPVLGSFIREFGFIAETVVLDDPAAASRNFYLVKKLNIEATPVVFAISKDGKTAFELVRGFVSISELRFAVAMSWKHLKSQGFRRGK